MPYPVIIGESRSDRVSGELLLKMGVPITLKGFAHTNNAVKLLLNDPKISMQELYSQIAASCGKTPSTVECSIRSVVNICAKNQTEIYMQLFSSAFKVTNSVFLAMMASHIRLT